MCRAAPPPTFSCTVQSHIVTLPLAAHFGWFKRDYAVFLLLSFCLSSASVAYLLSWESKAVSLCVQNPVTLVTWSLRHFLGSFPFIAPFTLDSEHLRWQRCAARSPARKKKYKKTSMPSVWMQLLWKVYGHHCVKINPADLSSRMWKTTFSSLLLCSNSSS